MVSEGLLKSWGNCTEGSHRAGVVEGESWGVSEGTAGKIMDALKDIVLTRTQGLPCPPRCL